MWCSALKKSGVVLAIDRGLGANGVTIGKRGVASGTEVKGDGFSLVSFSPYPPPC